MSASAVGGRGPVLVGGRSYLEADAADFADADDNNDNTLSFPEFCRLIRSRRASATSKPHTDDQLRSWFRALDHNKNGRIEKVE